MATIKRQTRAAYGC